MTASVRRAVTAVLTAVTLLASTACWHDDVDVRPDPRAWVVDVVPDRSFAAGQRATLVGDRHEVTLQFTVFATVCAPRAFEYTDGGGYGHLDCLINPIPGTVTEIDHSYPDLRVRELTAKAHVQVVAEHGTRPVETLFDREVGPLTIGVPEVLAPVSWPFDRSARRHGVVPDLQAHANDADQLRLRWVDQWTVGTVSVNSYARENLGLTEAEAAALLVSMRADIETVR